MLATDLANTEFQGAIQNPDDLLYVQFYWHEPIDKWESERVGKLVKMTKRVPVTDEKGVVTYKDTGEVLRVPFVRFMRPGDKETIMEVMVDESHKRRWPQKWMAWQMQEGLIDGEGTIPGWPIEQWTELNPEQIHELKYLRFSTVEQIAGASDAQVQRMGMGGLSLREKAKVALRGRMGAEVREEMARKDAELKDMRERMAALEAAILGKAAPQPPTLNEFVAPGAEPFSHDVERFELAKQYEAKFGKKPHHKLSIASLKAKLSE
jgi:hypothetical protein